MAEETQEKFYGLAFPVVTVRYAGPTNYKGSRYIATLRKGRDEIVRATLSYENEYGHRNHFTAARACWDKYRSAHEEAFEGDDDERVFIPGDLDPDTYAFTVVPAAFLN